MIITPSMIPLGPWNPGVVHQIFMGAGRSVNEAALAEIVKRDKAMGIANVLLHYGPRRAVDVYLAHSAVVRDLGVGVGVSFGLDGHEDDARHHHDVLTATEKGECMAAVATMPGCNMCGFDAEPAYDPGVPSTDGAIDAELTVKAFRRIAKDAFVFHQPWWKPTVHRRFPYKVFALGAGAVFPQTYGNNSETIQQLGKKRYDYIMPTYESEWAALEEGFRTTAGADDPRSVTFQAKAWDDIPHVYIRETLRRPITINWGEPEISPLVESCIRAIGILSRNAGRDAKVFYNPYDPATYETAVLRWQEDYNASASGRQHGAIHVDGMLGYESLGAMGLLPK